MLNKIRKSHASSAAKYKLDRFHFIDLLVGNMSMYFESYSPDVKLDCWPRQHIMSLIHKPAHPIVQLLIPNSNHDEHVSPID